MTEQPPFDGPTTSEPCTGTEGGPLSGPPTGRIPEFTGTRLSLFEFVVPGSPLGWARAGGGRTVRRFTPTPQRNYAGAIKLFCQNAMKGAPPLDGPIAIEISAIYPWPTSWSKRKRAVPASRWKVSTPDYDNIAKLCGDSLNTIAWVDDARICSASIRKYYGDIPCLRVTVRSLA